MAEQREVMNFVFYFFIYFLYLLLYTSIHKYIYTCLFCDPLYENRGMLECPSECANSAISVLSEEYTGIPDLAGIYWNTRRTNNKCKTNNADRIYRYIYILIHHVWHAYL